MGVKLHLNLHDIIIQLQKIHKILFLQQGCTLVLQVILFRLTLHGFSEKCYRKAI